MIFFGLGISSFWGMKSVYWLIYRLSMLPCNSHLVLLRERWRERERDIFVEFHLSVSNSDGLIILTFNDRHNDIYSIYWNKHMTVLYLCHDHCKMKPMTSFQIF